MSILVCRKILEHNVKPILQTINGLKIHTLSKFRTPLFKSTTHVVIKRNLFKFLRKPKKDELKIIDDMPDKYELIHRNTMERYVIYAQLATTITSLVMVFVIITRTGPERRRFTFINEDKLVLDAGENELLIYITILCALVVVMQLLIAKMPFRIYYASAEKKYVMILPSNLPFSNKRLVCKVGDIEKLPLSGILPWRDSRFRVNGEKDIILIEEHFRKPSDLWIMLGVQRDPDSDE